MVTSWFKYPGFSGVWTWCRCFNYSWSCIDDSDCFFGYLSEFRRSSSKFVEAFATSVISVFSYLVMFVSIASVHMCTFRMSSSMMFSSMRNLDSFESISLTCRSRVGTRFPSVSRALVGFGFGISLVFLHQFLNCIMSFIIGLNVMSIFNHVGVSLSPISSRIKVEVRFLWQVLGGLMVLILQSLQQKI